MTSTANDRNAGPALSDEEIIERFGGIRPMAAKLGVAVTTVQGWKNRGHIPENRRDDVLKAAAAHGVDLGHVGTTPAEMEPAPEPKPAPAETKLAPEPEPGPEAKPEPHPTTETKPAAPEPASAAEFPRRTPERPKQAEPRAGPVRPAAGGVPAIGWAALGLAGLAVVAVLTRPLWEPALYPGAGGAPGVDRTAAVEQALRQLEEQGQARYDDLRTRLTALEAGGGEAGKAIADQIGRIEEGVSGLGSTLKSLDGTVSGLETRLAALEAARGEVPESVRASLREIAADTQTLRADISALRQQLEAQEQVAADGIAGLRRDAGSLDKRVAELEARPVQTGEKIAALALAVGQVELALNSGLPYRKALDRLTTVAAEDTVVHGSVFRLSQWADTGIPAFAALQRRFTEVAPSIDRALADGGGEGWLERTWHSLSTVVTVRRVEGEGEISPVSRAEAALADSDLAGAVAALDAAGPLGEAGAAWVEDARARVFAEVELQTLYGQVIAPLAAGGEEAVGR